MCIRDRHDINRYLLNISEIKSNQAGIKQYIQIRIQHIMLLGGIKTVSYTHLLADGGSFASAVMIGNVAAVIGSIVSTRLMISRTSRFYGTEQGLSLIHI